MTQSLPDVLIVGGGLIGCSLAAELAERGAAVTVLERGKPGAEASGAAAGMLTAQCDASERSAFFELQLESRRLYPEWTSRLLEETGIDAGYRRTGLLQCAFEGSGNALSSLYEWQRAVGLRVETRGPEELAAEVDGRLSRRVVGGVFFPDEAMVDPRLLSRAVELAARRRGARLRTGVSARRFRLENGVCRGVETDEGCLDAGAVVDAAGAWAAFDPSLTIPIPVHPVRGQIVRIKMPGEALPTMVRSEEVYIVPRPDGTALLGSTEELVGFRNEVTAGAVERLLSASRRLVPSLEASRFVEAWSGLRPGTSDGLPLLGDSPVPGLFFATGHFRHGILLAPITARIVADAVQGVLEHDLSAFSPARFAEALRHA